MSKVENQQELTSEQIAEYRKASIEFYKDRMSFMKIQLEYEKLAADIEEHKLRGLMAQLKYAHITAPQEPDNNDDIIEKTH